MWEVTYYPLIVLCADGTLWSAMRRKTSRTGKSCQGARAKDCLNISLPLIVWGDSKDDGSFS